MPATALIIDDEPDIRELIAMTLTRMGLDHHTAANLEEARNLLDIYEFDVCLTDMRLPDGNGVEFVRHVHDRHPDLPVAVITAHGNMEAAVEAMKNGAYDFVSKPVDLKLLRNLVAQAVALADSRSPVPPVNEPENRPLETRTGIPTLGSAGGISETYAPANQDNDANRQPVAGGIRPGTASNRLGTPVRDGIVEKHPSAGHALAHGNQSLIGASAPMQSLRHMIVKVARTNAPVWITGESGTGKELIARLIHGNGPRANSNFVAINCGAIPSELMESELFGHRKGSFTGANVHHEGLFRRAEGGTLFLDEVAELPVQMQVKLLRAIQERSIREVGGTDEIPVDVRILSASHKDLATEVTQNRFRHDLYYRLNVISIRSPSLRDRPDDIESLCLHIMDRYAGETGASYRYTLAADALEQLQSYHFPGNVRELENILERAIALADDSIIDASLLQLESASTGTTPATGVGAAVYELPTPTSNIADRSKEPSVRGVDDSERDRLIQMLNETRWNRKLAAQRLGLTYRQLRYRIQQLGIDRAS